MQPTRGLVRLAFVITIVALASCRSAPRPTRIQERNVAEALPWLGRGVARERVVLELGTPSRSFEDGRILCYLLYRRGKDSALIATPPMFGWLDPGQASWQFVQYDLVLVFDADGKVAEHSLIRFR